MTVEEMHDLLGDLISHGYGELAVTVAEPIEGQRLAIESVDLSLGFNQFKCIIRTADDGC